MKIQYILIITFILFSFGKPELLSLPKPDFVCIDSLQDYRHPFSTPLSNLSYETYFGINYIDSLNALRVLIKMTDENGFIIQNSTDGGYNWKTTYVDTSYTFIDTNGKKQYYFPKNQFVEFHYISKDSCIIVCDNGLNLFSNDNCENWQKQEDSINITSYFFHKGNIIVKNLWKTFSGYPQIENERYTTTDKGITWVKIKFLEENLKDYYNQIRIIDSNTIFFPFYHKDSVKVTKPKIYNIRERTWESLPVVDGFGGKLNTEVLSKFDFTRIIERYIDSIRYRFIIRTRDGGYNWDTLYKCANTGLLRIKYFDSLNVLAWGPTYRLIKSTDGGKTWKSQQVENYTDDEISIDTNWYYLNFYQASWPDINSIFVTASFTFLYKYIPNTNGINESNEECCQVQIYPNPVNKGNPVYIELSGLSEGNYELEIMDILGRQYYSFSSYFSPVQTLVSADPNLHTGIYFLLLKEKNKIRSIKKLIVQ